MAFNATLETTDHGIAKITLTGELDGSVAEEFKAKVQEAADQQAKRLVLIMDELEFIPEEHRVRFEEAFEKQKEMEGLEFLEDLGLIHTMHPD